MFTKAHIFPMSLSDFITTYTPMLEALTDPFVVIEFAMPSKIILSNRFSEQLFAYDKQELLNCKMIDLFSETSAKKYLKNRESYNTNPHIIPLNFKGIEHDYYGKKKNGEEFPLDRSISPIIIDNKQYLLVGFRDLTEVKKYEKSLKEKHLELISEHDVAESSKQYIKTQETFIDNLCHELRNPLNGIVHGVEMLQDAIRLLQQKSVTTSEQDRILEDMMNNIEIVSTCIKQQKVIVDDVLTVSKLENGKTKLVIKPFDLIEIIQDVVKIFSASIEQKKIELNLDIPRGSLWLKGDPYQLSQVIINVLGNAIKFTDYGTITLSVDTELSCVSMDTETQEVIVKFCVKDTGVGMSPREISNLFERFGQGNVVTGKEYNGSGLGLVISKKIVELMNGSIILDSTKWAGTSCSFHVSCQSLTQQEQIRAISNKGVARNPSKIILPDLSGKNILVVEDNIINMKILCNILEPTKSSIYKAFDGEEALEIFVAHRFDLVFMDIGLPKMNGLEVTKKIRDREQVIGGHTIIVGLSGFTREDTKQQALSQSGMDEYLTKPYEKHKIFEIISRYFLSDNVSSQLNISEQLSIKELGESPSTQPLTIMCNYKNRSVEPNRSPEQDLLSNSSITPSRRKKCLIS